MVSIPGVGLGTMLVMPKPNSGSRSSSLYVMRSGTRPDSNSSRPEAIRESGEVMAGQRGADARIDADKQHANSGLDAIIEEAGADRARAAASSVCVMLAPMRALYARDRMLACSSRRWNKRTGATRRPEREAVLKTVQAFFDTMTAKDVEGAAQDPSAARAVSRDAHARRQAGCARFFQRGIFRRPAGVQADRCASESGIRKCASAA